MSRPPLGLSTEVEIVNRPKSDADTLRVRITREFNVRLSNTSCPEKDTIAGKDAKAFVDSLVPPGTILTLFIPTGNPINLMDINSFERIVGELWLDDENELGEYLNYQGYGRPTKEMG